jgi:hypothetical protein
MENDMKKRQKQFKKVACLFVYPVVYPYLWSMKTTGGTTLEKQDNARLRKASEALKSLDEIISESDIEKEIVQLLSLLEKRCSNRKAETRAAHSSPQTFRPHLGTLR